MKKKLAPKPVMLIMISMVFIFGIISTTGCKTSDPEQIPIPVPYDIEGNIPK
jgi:hypothetical protein